uniref:39S ribosomal protein L50, mitochondrial n=1 Tax=Caenorhabditis tropicalis TaxID=1561998 RepID=A0A1I7UUM2_9PELO
MGRNKHKVQKYVQKAVYTCRDTYIRSSTIKKLSESVNHDLQGLLHQAHLFSLAPNKPFPLTSRYLISNGFEEEWERPRNTLKNDEDNERLHEVIEMYSDVLPDCSIHPLYPNIKRTWDSDCRKLAAAQSGPSGGLQQAYEALNGRYSKRDLAVDMLPLLVPIDRVERQKKARSRRHLHQFKTYTDIKTDGDSLINVVGRWSIK